MSLYRGLVVAVDATRATVEIDDLCPGTGFPDCQWVGGTAPTVAQWVLVADVGDPACPDLIVIGALS